MFVAKETEEETKPRWRFRGKGKKVSPKGENAEGLGDPAEDTRNDLSDDRPSDERNEAPKAKKWRFRKNDEPLEDVKEEEEAGSLKTSSSGFSFHDQRQTKAVLHQFGADPKDVITVEREDGVPSPESREHVVIRVQASTVTLRDCLLRRGLDFDVVNPSCLPLVPGHDVVGRVVAVGLDVDDFKPGDRVAALIRTGGNARYASVPASSLVRVPRTMDSSDAVCMVSVYSAAYHSLKMVTESGPMFSLKQKKVLIIGGMDGVGQALVQMCNKARAEVYATSPDGRQGYVRAVLGAIPLPESPSEWLPRVDGEMDVVFDGNCGDGLENASKALNGDGQLVCFGYSSMLKEDMGLFGAPMSAHMNRMRTRMSAKCVDIWELFQEDPDTYKQHLASLFQLVKWNKLKPHIAKRVTLADVPLAHKKVEQGNVRGCVVCLPWRHIARRNITQVKGEEREEA